MSGPFSFGSLCAGYGYYRPHVQMMDPGWLSGVRSQRGPEDQGTYDGGNDPVGVVKRYTRLGSMKHAAQQ